MSNKNTIRGDEKSNGLDTVIFVESDKYGKIDALPLKIITKNLTNITVVKVKPDRISKHNRDYTGKRLVYMPAMENNLINGQFYALSDTIPRWSNVLVVMTEHKKSPKLYHYHAKKSYRNLQKRLRSQDIYTPLNTVKISA